MPLSCHRTADALGSLSVSGSPSTTSRTACLLRHLDARPAAQGHDAIPLDVRTLSAEALLPADFGHPEIIDVVEHFHSADGVVVGTPAYRPRNPGS